MEISCRKSIGHMDHKEFSPNLPRELTNVRKERFIRPPVLKCHEDFAIHGALSLR
jgi:hypothetical protein